MSRYVSVYQLIIIVFITIFFFINYTKAQYNFFFTSHSIPSAVGKASFKGTVLIENPARLNVIDSFFVSTSYSPSRFALPELSPAELLVGWRAISSTVLGLSLGGLGCELFSEYAGGIHLSHSFGSLFTLGTSFDFSRISIKNYSSDEAFNINIGAIIEIDKNFTAGFNLNNITRSYYYGGSETVEQTAVFGLGFSAADELFFDIDAIIDINESSALCVASTYHLYDIGAIRLAARTNPLQFEIGASIQASNNINLITLINYYEELGFSPGIGFSFYW